MAFDEHRAALTADLTRLEDLVRQARDVANNLARLCLRPTRCTG
jgi:hypothetical protein